jgi:hypothetical protein
MHKNGPRRYAGKAGETVTVTTKPSGSGAAAFRLDGAEKGGVSPFVFQLKSNPGAETRLSVALTGETGEVCEVRIATVDNGEDVDFLVATVHNPFPMNSYTCTVAGSEAT